MRKTLMAALVLAGCCAVPCLAQDSNGAWLKGTVVAAGACCDPLKNFTIIIDVQAPPQMKGRHEVNCVGDLDPNFPLNFCFDSAHPGDCIELDGYIGAVNYGNTYNDRLFATSGFRYPQGSCY